MEMKQKLKMGMVGGGIGSFIGAIHRNAAFLDNQIELVCGSFSSNYENSIDTGKDLFLNPQRVYKNYQDIQLFFLKLEEVTVRKTLKLN